MRPSFCSMPAALAVASFLTAGGAGASIVLNEVLYDPLGEDAGAEFVEIWNGADTTATLERFTIESGDGARPGVWTVLFLGTATDTIPPHAPFLVAPARLSGPLQNGPDAIRLVGPSGAAIDRLGWGALEDSSQFEGAPAPDVPSGSSLARRDDGVDRDRNDEDWEGAPVPTPGSANRPARAVGITGAASLRPEVVWPGEESFASIEVLNTGREPLPAGSWDVTIQTRAYEEGLPPGDWLDASASDGPGLGPGESVAAGGGFFPGWAGPFEARALVRIAGADDAGGWVAIDSASVFGRVGAGAVVIHEFAYRDLGAGEWVELLAREAVPAWTRYSLGDATGATRQLRPLGGSGGAAAGAYRVVASDPSRFLARFALPESLVLAVEGGWLALNDTPSSSGTLPAPWADVVRLVGPDGGPCDAVPYDGAWSTRGGSLERLSPTLPSASPQNWTESASSIGGTPGAPNSVAAPGLEHPSALPLLAVPARVLRHGGEGAGALVVEVGASAAGRAVRISILDLRGRTRRLLADGVRFGGAGALVWDGRDASGAPVAPGIYVVRLEAVSDAGEAPRRAAVAIAVAP